MRGLTHDRLKPSRNVKNQLAKQGASTHAPRLPEDKTLGELPIMEQTSKKRTSKP